MAKIEIAGAATRSRFEAELARVRECLERELVRAAIVSDPSEIWPAHAKWGEVVQRISESPEVHRLSVVFFAAEIVQRTFQSLYGGARERTISALEELACAIDHAYSVMHDVGVVAYLTSIANVGGTIAFQEEPPVDSRELHALRSALDWHSLQGTATTASAIAKHLEQRRPAAVEGNIYAPKGAGPFAHFCHELTNGLALEEIAEVTGEMPHATGTSRRSAGGTPARTFSTRSGNAL